MPDIPLDSIFHYKLAGFVMRIVTVSLLALVFAGSALAQTRPQTGESRDEPAKTAYAAMAERDRIAIQTDLIWTGDYSGQADGAFGPRAIAAVKALQKRGRSKATGVLTAKERSALATAARRQREAAGWRIVEDTATGTRLGIPAKLTPQQSVIPGGTRWASTRGEVQVETFRIIAPGTTLGAVYETQRQVADRKASYNVLRSDFFVITGMQGAKKFYLRGQEKDGEVRGFSIHYDQAMAGTLDMVAIAMASAFEAFPAGVAVAGPPPRRKVEYGTAVFLSEQGHAATAQYLIDGCQTLSLSGYGPADLVAEDKESGLALLRVYGGRNLRPIALAGSDRSGQVTLLGVADPSRQSGAGEISTANAAIVPARGDGRRSIEPAPALGFLGAAVLDGAGRLAGIVDLRMQVVAGPPDGAGPSAMLLPAFAIKTFLAAQNVAASGVSDANLDAAKAGVARVICVRK